MGCVAAPACKAALAEATRLWPSRRKTSDGICGDPRHQAGVSDHNQGNAWDLSHDPAQGCDAHALVEGIRRRQDKRVKYIISNRRICGPGSSGGGWNWKPYSGSNPHASHTHVSIWPSARNSTAPWFVSQPVTPVIPPPTQPLGKRPWPVGAEKLPGGGYSKAQGKQKDGNSLWIQRVIDERTNYSGPMKPDGFYGQMTHEAVWGFQGAVGLKQTGVVNPQTWEALNRFAG